jgi:hypothetical protein
MKIVKIEKNDFRKYWYYNQKLKSSEQYLKMMNPIQWVNANSF